MMITFNPGKNELFTMEFNRREDWNQYVESFNKVGELQPLNHPDRFPCVMIYDNNILPIDAEHNKYYNFFLYYYANA